MVPRPFVSLIVLFITLPYASAAAMDPEKSDHVQKKAALAESPIHSENVQDKEVSSSSSREDVENHAAVPDDGTPRPWTLKAIITTAFLSALYVGQYCYRRLNAQLN